MGMNVHDAPYDDSAYTNSPTEKAAARIVVDAMLADDKPVMREKVLAMIFGQRS